MRCSSSDKSKFQCVIVFLIGISLALLLVAEASSPLYVFFNDTPQSFDGNVIGSASPAPYITLKPGEVKFLDMPWWWGEASVVNSLDIITPTYDFIVVKVVKISHLKPIPRPPRFD